MSKHKKSLQKIKMLVSDVDGCFTDGTIWLDSNLHWRRSFNILDGVGIKLLQAEGYEIGVITGGSSEDVRVRMEFLGITHFFDNASDKIPSFRKILKATGLKASEIAYIGDEIYDLPIIKEVGFSACPPRAVASVKKTVDHICKAEGGYGAVREVCDLILQYGSKVKRK